MWSTRWQYGAVHSGNMVVESKFSDRLWLYPSLGQAEQNQSNIFKHIKGKNGVAMKNSTIRIHQPAHQWQYFNEKHSSQWPFVTFLLLVYNCLSSDYIILYYIKIKLKCLQLQELQYRGHAIINNKLYWEFIGN